MIGHVLLLMVCFWLHWQSFHVARPCFWHQSWPIQKHFIGDTQRCGKSKPGCQIVGAPLICGDMELAKIIQSHDVTVRIDSAVIGSSRLSYFMVIFSISSRFLFGDIFIYSIGKKIWAWKYNCHQLYHLPCTTFMYLHLPRATAATLLTFSLIS